MKAHSPAVATGTISNIDGKPYISKPHISTALNSTSGESTDGIRIVIISNDAGESENIRTWLARDMRIPWHMSLYPNAKAVPHIVTADLIILKPETEGLSSGEVFEELNDLVFETPILVLMNPGQGEREHALSTYVMERGAADIVVRGQFARLVDAIEFALIRQKISSTLRKDSDSAKELQRSLSESDLKDSQEAHGKDKNRHEQIMRMFMGGYTSDTTK